MTRWMPIPACPPMGPGWSTGRGRAANGGLAHILDLDSGSDRTVDSFGGSISQFSPDGRLVVGQGDGELIIQAADGTSPAKVLGPKFGDPHGHYFEFSPDGTKVFLTMGSPGVTTIIDVATGASVETTQPIPNYPSWQRLAPAP